MTKSTVIKSGIVVFMFFHQKVLVVTQAEVQHIIQGRIKELQDLKHNIDVLKVREYVAQHRLLLFLMVNWTRPAW